jgi:phenol 2-monooxygenase
MGSTGRYCLLILASQDLLDPDGASQTALRSCEQIIAKSPLSTVDLILLHPLEVRFEWENLPPFLRRIAEMRTYGITKDENAYEIYGITKEEGAMVVVRPDGYIGTITPLTRPMETEAYFKGCLLEI